MRGTPDIIDVRQAADLLGVSVRRVQQLIASGRLPAARLTGGTAVIQKSDLAKVKDRKPGRPPKAPPPEKPARRARGK